MPLESLLSASTSPLLTRRWAGNVFSPGVVTVRSTLERTARNDPPATGWSTRRRTVPPTLPAFTLQLVIVPARLTTSVGAVPLKLMYVQLKPRTQMFIDGVPFALPI